MSVPLPLERLLRVDPRDGGCGHAMDVLHAYVELLATDPDAAVMRYPAVDAHLRSCGPCADDVVGLLAALHDA